MYVENVFKHFEINYIKVMIMKMILKDSNLSLMRPNIHGVYVPAVPDLAQTVKVWSDRFPNIFGKLSEINNLISTRDF